MEFNKDSARWGLRPQGCTDHTIIISPELDPKGENITCPENINLGDSKFIWHPDLDLDNHLLCQYTLSSGCSGSSVLLMDVSLVFFLVVIVLTMIVNY